MNQAVSAPSVSGFASELAELLIQTESVQSDSAQLEQEAARNDFLSEAQHQVDALHAAAEDVRNGAWVSAAITAASSACEVVSALDKFDASMAASKCSNTFAPEIAEDTRNAKIWESAGSTLNQLAAPANSLVFESTQADDNAKAKYFETLSEKAKWLEGDAGNAIDQAAKLGDKVLDLLSGIDQDQSAASNAIIGRI